MHSIWNKLRIYCSSTAWFLYYFCFCNMFDTDRSRSFRGRNGKMKSCFSYKWLFITYCKQFYILYKCFCKNNWCLNFNFLNIKSAERKGVILKCILHCLCIYLMIKNRQNWSKSDINIKWFRFIKNVHRLERLWNLQVLSSILFTLVN